MYRQRAAGGTFLANEIKSNFASPCNVAVHWDGKLIRNVPGKVEPQEHCAVVITAPGNYKGKLLNAAEFLNFSGKSQADALFSTSQNWEVTDSIKAMVFETTSANTDAKSGAATNNT